MEVFDFEDDHLAAALPNERDTEEIEDQEVFVSPTEQERISKQKSAKLAADYKHQLVNHHARRSRPTIQYSAETDTSSSRYQHLPSYAQSSFVTEEKKPETISIPRPPNLPKETAVPPDRVHKVLKLTAERAVTKPQLEVMLKVKQADSNPEFAFLLPHNKYHAYYEWYKKEHKRKQEKLERKEKQAGVMSGLLGMYSSSSSEDDNEPTETSQKRSLPAEEEEDRKASRLKRARMLKEHFERKMQEK